MEEPQITEEKHWYVLNYFIRSGRPSLQKTIEDFNNQGNSLELYAPIIRPAFHVNGKIVYRDRLLTFNYIFVKGTRKEIKALCADQANNLSMMLNRGSEDRYAVLSDEEMESFRIIARIHTNTIPFFNIEDIDLEEGDKVEVVSGEYAGLKGVFVPKSRSTKGNLVIAATAGMGAVLWDVNAKFIRILEFARDSRRQYDIIDSFTQKLFPILRRFHAREHLTDKDKSTLSVFNQRMGVVTLDNHKLEAKLLALLMCTQTIIGDKKGFQKTSARFQKRAESLTNPWTLALVDLVMAVAGNDMARLSKAYLTVKDIEEDLTKSQRQLLDEFEHYTQG